MPYREELDAALHRVNATEEELAEARKASDVDHQRIAELERKLAEAQTAEKQAQKENATNDPKTTEPKKEDEAPAKPRRRGELSPLGVRLFQGFFVLLFLALGSTVVWRVLRRKPMPKVDVSGMLPEARSLARETLPDAVLVSIKAKYVDPRGIDDLASHGYVDYRFVSPSRAAKAGASRSAPACAVTISYNERTKLYRTRFYPEVTISNGYETSCGVPLAHPPSCTANEVWNEAIRRGAPKNGVATYFALEASSEGEPTWRIDVDPAYGARFPDRCPFAQ